MSKNEIQRVSNPLAQSSNFAAATQDNTMGAVASAGEIARVQAQLVYAAQVGRNPRQSLDNMLNNFQIPELAKESLYQYAKGGSDITGLSIRAVEAMALDWGHIDLGWRPLEQKQDSTIVEAFAWDLVSNVRRTITFRVPHFRDTKQGRKRLEDDREIYEHIANQASRRVRACALALFPHYVQVAVKQQIANTMAATFDITPEYLKDWLNAFKKYGVTKEMIEKRIQRGYDSITPAQMVGLVNIYNSLKDGIGVVSDYFEVPAPAGDKANTLAGKAAAAAAAAEAPEGKPEQDTLV